MQTESGMEDTLVYGRQSYLTFLLASWCFNFAGLAFQRLRYLLLAEAEATRPLLVCYCPALRNAHGNAIAIPSFVDCTQFVRHSPAHKFAII
jgi:hypothetical protein